MTPTPHTDRFAPPSDDDARTLRRAASLIDAFRTIDPAIPSAYIAAFLAVAAQPGLGVTEYAERLDMIRPVCSRVLLEIGVKTRTGGPGYGLVDRMHSTVDMRAVNYYLTPKGRRLLAQVLKYMEA